MKKIVYILLAVIMIVGLFCGCVDDPECEYTVPETVTEPSSAFKMGDYVYVVYALEGAGLCVRLGVVVAEADGYVTVTHYVANNVEDMEKMLAYLANSSSVSDGDASLYPVENCYRTSKEAWAVTGREPFGSSETPSGNIFDNR